MEQQLTKREALIERILHMNDAEVTEVLDLIETLHNSITNLLNHKTNLPNLRTKTKPWLSIVLARRGHSTLDEFTRD